MVSPRRSAWTCDGPPAGPREGPQPDYYECPAVRARSARPEVQGRAIVRDSYKIGGRGVQIVQDSPDTPPPKLESAEWRGRGRRRIIGASRPHILAPSRPCDRCPPPRRPRPPPPRSPGASSSPTPAVPSPPPS